MVVTVLIVHLLVCIWGWCRLGVMAVTVAYPSVRQGSHPIIRFLMTKYESSDLH